MGSDIGDGSKTGLLGGSKEASEEFHEGATNCVSRAPSSNTGGPSVWLLSIVGRAACPPRIAIGFSRSARKSSKSEFEPFLLPKLLFRLRGGGTLPIALSVLGDLPALVVPELLVVLLLRPRKAKRP
jgi:hypothetical protein